MTRSAKVEYQISDPITLEELRWLVLRCRELPGESKIAITGRRMSNMKGMEDIPASITVSSEMPSTNGKQTEFEI